MASLEESFLEGMLKSVSTICHPIRFKIVELLDDEYYSENTPFKGLYINQIAEKIGEERRLVSFHLTTLEDHGLVQSKFKIIDEPKPMTKGRAGRFYMRTNFGKDVYRAVFNCFHSYENYVEEAEKKNKESS